MIRKLKEWKQAHDFEKWKREHPQEYERRLRILQQRELDRVNKIYLEQGYIKEPYKTYAEMLERRGTDSSHELTEEETRQIFKEAGYSDKEFYECNKERFNLAPRQV